MNDEITAQMPWVPSPEYEVPSLRDQFAMAALTGMAASDTRDSPENFAKASYKLADAMMEARKQ